MKDTCLLIIAALLLIYMLSDNKESFCSLSPSGAEENIHSTPMPVSYKRGKKVNEANLRGSMFETRFPGINKQRNSYDDSPANTDAFTNTSGMAELSKLPISFNPSQPLCGYSLDQPLNNPKFTPTKLDDYLHNIAKRVDKITGYNPSDSLPGQYADRSKTSNELYIAAPDLQDARLEVIPGEVVRT